MDEEINKEKWHNKLLNMKIYSEIELREMISNLRLVKEMSNDYELQDKSEIDLTSQAIKLLQGKIKEIKCNNCIYSNVKNIKL